MTSKKQNRRRNPAAHVDSVGAEKTASQNTNYASENIHFLPLPSIRGVQRAVLIVLPKLFRPWGPRLTTKQIFAFTRCSYTADILKSGWTLIDWPDGVAVGINTVGISSLLGVTLYNQARSALEGHFADSQNCVKSR